MTAASVPTVTPIARTRWPRRRGLAAKWRNARINGRPAMMATAQNASNTPMKKKRVAMNSAMTIVTRTR